MNNLDIGFDAGRLCEAIARIGYEPDSAIMDIVDNSVSAKASNVYVMLSLLEGKTIKSRNAVQKYQIIDDGVGMDEDGILKAFSLGTKREYEVNSLSKYGLGLKSAGLSLGTKISIVSKKNNIISQRYIFDKDSIEEKNKFIILRNELSDTELEFYNNLLSGTSGTVVEIEGCEKINHASPDSTRNKLKKRLGVVYYSFLQNESDALNMFIKVKPHSIQTNYEKIEPKDILFTDSDDFKLHWTPDKYDFTSPYLALNDPWKLHDLEGNPLPDINVQAVVFPQKVMSLQKSPLSKEKKSKIASYDISKENSGFFIYRNGRLIRWGDDLGGLISKNDFNIRIRLDISSEHDDVLHVDVTKQRLEIDDENWSRLEKIVSKSLQTAKTVRELCQEYLRESNVGEEGVTFSHTLQGVPEDDPDEIVGAKPSEEVVQRKKRSAEESKVVIEKIKEERDSDTNQNPDILYPVNSSKQDEDVFRKINYSNNVPYGHVWKPYHDAIEGAFVNVNKNHPYYSEFLSRFPENSVERVSLEAVIFSVGLAENNVKHNFENIDKDVLEDLFKKMHKNISTWLAEWSSENYNMSEE